MLAFSTLASLAVTLGYLTSVSASPILVRDDYTPVRFKTFIPLSWCAGSSYDLTWEGGSGQYTLQGTIKYPDEGDFHPQQLLDHSTDTSFTWQAPTSFGAGATYQFSIADSVEQQGDASYQITQDIPIVNC